MIHTRHGKTPLRAFVVQKYARSARHNGNTTRRPKDGTACFEHIQSRYAKTLLLVFFRAERCAFSWPQQKCAQEPKQWHCVVTNHSYSVSKDTFLGPVGTEVCRCSAPQQKHSASGPWPGATHNFLKPSKFCFTALKFSCTAWIF